MTLALTYRPRTFQDVLGQDHVVIVLETLLRRWRDGEIDLPSGLLLTGLKGSGKTTSARIIAAHINCTGGIPPCGECSSCVSTQNFTSGSVIELDGATSGGVDNMREMKQWGNLSHSGHYRIFIIDEVHAMSREAFSALLKQLEEPSPNVLYILVTTDMHSVPETIKSRCLIFTFAAISDSRIIDRLQYVCTQEGIEPGEGVLSLIAKKSRGSLRDALMTLEQLSIVEDVTKDRFEKLWPDSLDDFSKDFMRTVLAGDVLEGMAVVNKAYGAYRNSALLSDAVLNRLRDYIMEVLIKKGSRSQLTPRMATKLIELTWSLRIYLRGAADYEPVLIEGLWFSFLRELGTLKVETGSGAYPNARGRTALPQRGSNGTEPHATPQSAFRDEELLKGLV